MKNTVVKWASHIIIGGAPLTLIAAHADTLGPPSNQVDSARKNAEALRVWQQQSGATAELTPGPDGTTTIEFKGGVSADYYHNSIQTPAGVEALYTPLKSGTFFKVLAQGDMRATSAQGGVTYIQGAFVKSDDRAVLAHYDSQLSSFQLGRTDKDYQLTLGDAVVNYSQLSSSLGMRGFSGIKQFDTYTFSGHLGVVAESWEALMNKATLDGAPARTQYLRDVYGFMLENAVSQHLTAYVTTQSYHDQPGSLDAGTSYLLPANARSSTLGFAYQEGAFSLNGESAVSRLEEQNQALRKGHATILDSSYRLERVGFRAGFHHLSPSFASVSQMAQPGIREGYLGVDWTAATWLTLGAEYRDSRQTTPSYTLVNIYGATPIVGTVTRLRSLTSRANINFGPDLPGWGVTFQDMHGHGTDAQGLATASSSFLSSLNYNSQTWSGMVSVGSGRVANAFYPQADSHSTSWQMQLGRQFSDGSNEIAASWSASASIMAGRQQQDLVNLGTSTRSTFYGLVFALQRVGAFQVNSSVTENITTQPAGGPDLKSRAVQFDATHPFGQPAANGQRPGSVKVYVRNNVLNSGSIALQTGENVAGLQVNYIW